MTKSPASSPGQRPWTSVPDEKGHFGLFGGRFVPETLMPALEELSQAFGEAVKDSTFKAELDDLLTNYAGRPTPVYEAARLSKILGGARIFLKREDLAHTGAHKINNALGQVLLAKRMGKKAHHRRDRGRPARGGHRHRRRPFGA